MKLSQKPDGENIRKNCLYRQNQSRMREGGVERCHEGAIYQVLQREGKKRISFQEENHRDLLGRLQHCSSNCLKLCCSVSQWYLLHPEALHPLLLFPHPRDAEVLSALACLPVSSPTFDCEQSCHSGKHCLQGILPLLFVCGNKVQEGFIHGIFGVLLLWLQDEVQHSSPAPPSNANSSINVKSRIRKD